MSHPIKQINAYTFLDNELATCAVSSIEELYDDCQGDGGSEEDKDECEPKPVPNFTGVQAAFQTVKSFFFANNTGNMMRTL
jgi:hypothetical protein